MAPIKLTNLVKNKLSTVDNSNIVGKVLYEYDSLPSTNARAIQLLSETTLPEGAVIAAGYQSDGRGQMGNRWQSAAGLNLMLSVIFRPVSLPVSRLFDLNKAVSLAVFDLVRQLVRGQTSVKWPNDIVVQNRKISGILIQNGVQGQQVHWSVAGIGLNVNQQDFPPELPNATSLALESSRTYELMEVRTRLFLLLDHYYSLLHADNGSLDVPYRNNLYRRGTETIFNHQAQGAFTGIIEDVDSLGRLIIRQQEGGRGFYNLKEISYR